MVFKRTGAGSTPTPYPPKRFNPSERPGYQRRPFKRFKETHVRKKIKQKTKKHCLVGCVSVGVSTYSVSHSFSSTMMISTNSSANCPGKSL